MRNGKGERGRPAELMSVFATWYAVVVVGLLQEEPEPVEKKELHVGVRDNCEHMQTLLTTVVRRHWEWQEGWPEEWVPGFFKYQTAMATLDV